MDELKEASVMRSPKQRAAIEALGIGKARRLAGHRPSAVSAFGTPDDLLFAEDCLACVRLSEPRVAPTAADGQCGPTVFANRDLIRRPKRKIVWLEGEGDHFASFIPFQE
ncbi:MAG: hypothetical protein AAFR47_16110, partial [Pseudomonadota bacterium]